MNISCTVCILMAPYRIYDLLAGILHRHFLSFLNLHSNSHPSLVSFEWLQHKFSQSGIKKLILNIKMYQWHHKSKKHLKNARQPVLRALTLPNTQTSHGRYRGTCLWPDNYGPSATKIKKNQCLWIHEWMSFYALGKDT